MVINANIERISFQQWPYTNDNTQEIGYNDARVLLDVILYCLYIRPVYGIIWFQGDFWIIQASVTAQNIISIKATKLVSFLMSFVVRTRANDKNARYNIITAQTRCLHDVIIDECQGGRSRERAAERRQKFGSYMLLLLREGKKVFTLLCWIYWHKVGSWTKTETDGRNERIDPPSPSSVESNTREQ